MGKLPQFPVMQDKGPPFLNDGTTELEFMDGRVADGPPQDPIPAFVLDVKVLKSTNPMNAVGQTHTIRVKARGFSWGNTVQILVSAFGCLPKMAINPEVAEGLLSTGKLKGRKAVLEQVSKSNDKGVWREYKASPLDSNSVL